MISTHTLTWSVTLFLTEKNGIQKFQLTRSRGAWPVTPAWCVTLIRISTHTLTWSVTYRFSTLALYYANFNSHAHVERDFINFATQFTLKISTHTLTWSVTSSDRSISLEYLNFNSHAHVERDDFLWNADETKFHFNSHAHVERDSQNLAMPIVSRYFNSHAHVERDQVMLPFSITSLSFQLTRSRGAWQPCMNLQEVVI